MRSLLLIKHSLPEILETIPAREWHLSEEGQCRCLELAKVTASYQPKVVISSLEPKAMETGQLMANSMGCPFFTADDLHEHDRTNEPFHSHTEFEARVMQFFRSPEQLVMGKETAQDALVRFEKAVNHILKKRQDGNLAIVAHGAVISLFVAHQTGMEPYLLWKRLGLPSFVVLSLPENRLITVENLLS